MNFSCHYYSHLWIILTIVNYPLKVNTTKKYSEIHDIWIGYGATQNPQTNPIFFSESPLLIIVYISVLLQYTAIKCASGSYTCSNLYILKLASPALTSCDARWFAVEIYKNKKYSYNTYNVIYISSLITLFGRFRNLTSFHRSVCSFCHPKYYNI